MKLNLQYAPTPENAPRFADQCVESAKSVAGVDLDYTPASLHIVDGIIERFRTQGVSSNQVAETLFVFGCYVGEVMVRHASGTWQNASETAMRDLAGFPLVVSLGDSGQICNPIGKAFKRLDNGIEDSLPYFYQVFTGQSAPTPPQPEKRKWWKRW